MITPAEALALIMETVQPGSAVTLPLDQAAGHFLASDLAAPISLPLFDNSAMDGYALRHDDTATASETTPVQLRDTATVPAGHNPFARNDSVQPGTAMQIFTGAMIPPHADAVVRQEDVLYDENSSSIILKAPVPHSANIRRAGEEITAGESILSAGDELTPAAVGLLASLGISNVEVVQKPRIGCIVTGSELRPPGTELEPGQIYNSNASMLAAALSQLGTPFSFQAQCSDDLDALTEAFCNALNDCDVVLVTGGVSVGGYDFVRAAAENLGIHEVFWRIAQKPGKPMYFGVTPEHRKVVFGLPGNPASVLTCFYEYVRPALRRMMGAKNPAPLTLPGHLSDNFSRRGTLTQFMKASLASDGSVTILERQGSHMLSTFAQANCLAVIPAEATELQKGDQVQVHLLAP